MRVGLLGGSFDPPHLGHCIVADWARDRLALDRVLWVPARRSPLKSGIEPAEDRHRLAMVSLIVHANPAFSVSEMELERDPPSYTVDTLSATATLFPSWKLYWIVGEDSLRTFHRWKDPGRILELSTVCVYPRRDGPDPVAVRSSEEAPDGYDPRIVHLDAPRIDIASTEIRRRVADGRPIRYLVPDDVETYIHVNRLYRD